MLILPSWLWRLALGLGLVLTLGAPTVSAQTDPERIVRLYVEADGRGDVEGALALLADDAAIYASPSGQSLCFPAPCAGKAGIRQELARRAALQTRYTSLDFQVYGNIAIDRVEFRADTVRSFGLERVIIVRTYEVRNGRIASIFSLQDLSDPQTLAYAQRGRRTDVRLPGATVANPEATVRQLLAAENRGDVEAAVALFTDDAALLSTPGFGACDPIACVGKAAIRQEIQRRVATRTQVAIRAYRQFGSVAADWVEVRSDVARANGVERYLAVRVYDTWNGRITAVHAVYDLADLPTAALKAALAGPSWLPAPAAAPIVQRPRGLPRTGEPDLPVGLVLPLAVVALTAGLVIRARR